MDVFTTECIGDVNRLSGVFCPLCLKGTLSCVMFSLPYAGHTRKWLCTNDVQTAAAAEWGLLHLQKSVVGFIDVKNSDAAAQWGTLSEKVLGLNAP